MMRFSKIGRYNSTWPQGLSVEKYFKVFNGDQRPKPNLIKEI